MRMWRYLGVLVVAVISVAYCLPGHPTAGRMVVLDAALHIGLFLALAAVLAPLGKRVWVLASLAVLGLALEVVQWQVVGFAHLEWNDILSNEAGVAIAALIHTCRHRTPHP